jgi:glutamyl-tRNA reductase
VQNEIVIVGMNHRSAPVEVRESVAFENGRVSDALRRLIAYQTIREAALLSTCNRVEVVAAASDAEAACRDVKQFLDGERARCDGSELEDHLYTFRGRDAVRHLFRVAASLDSLVVGEPQILGQLKQFYGAAREAGTVGALLHGLFHRSFSVAKRVRTETGIASRAVSVSSVAVDLASRIFDSFSDKTVMLIGAGKMGDLMARQLQRCGVKSLMVTNRTFERAVALAERMHGSPIVFEDFPRYLKLADLVIGCTGAPEILIRGAAVEKVLRERKQQAMFFIDIGDRRNFDPAINDIDNAYLYNIDDLKAAAEENLQERSSEAARAEEIVIEEVERFGRWLNSLDRAPTITALRRRFDEVRRLELARSLSGSLKDLSPEQRHALDDMTAAMMNKLLHIPISQLKNEPEEEGVEESIYLAALTKLFRLERK